MLGWPDGHHDQPVDALRDERGERPGDARAPVVADHMGSLDLELVEDGDQVRHAPPDRVRLDGRRPVRFAEATEVWGNHTHAGAGECRNLVPPDPRGIGEAVQEQHRRARALVEHREGDPVGCNAPH